MNAANFLMGIASLCPSYEPNIHRRPHATP